MTQRQQKVVVPAVVMEKIDAVRQRTLKVRIASAIVAALGMLLAAMALAMLVDWLTTLYDSPWRMLLTYSALGAATLTFCAWVATAWRQSQQIHPAAVDVDREIPQLEQRWSTIAQLATSPHGKNVHPAMYRKVAQEASSWSPRVQPNQIVSLDRMVHTLWALVAITAVLGTAVLIDSHQTLVLLRRFWAPNTLISATELANLPGNIVVARGEPLEITAQIEGSPVQQATLFLEPLDNDPQSVSLLPKGDDRNRLSHRIRSVKQPLRYRLQAGDGQTPWYQVHVADRPELGEVQISVIPPAYTGQEAKQLDKLPRKISSLQGSVLQLAIKPKADVDKIYLRLGGDRTEKLTLDKQGWYRWETLLKHSFAMSPILTEKHGLTNRRPPTCQVQCREDTPPVVKILKPNDQIAVLPNDTVPISFAAKDDIAIGSAELLVFHDRLGPAGKPLPLATIPIPLADQQGKTEIQGNVDLDLSQFDLANGAQLSFAIRVNEERPKPATPSYVRKTPTKKNSPSPQLSKAKDTKLANTDSPATDPPATKPPTEANPNNSPLATNDRQSATAPQSTSSQADNNKTSPDPSSHSSPLTQTGYLKVPLAKSTSSPRMQLTIDESATSFDGQRRLQLEIAIAPYLEEIDIALGKAQQLSRSVLDDVESNPEWQAKHNRNINQAESQVSTALNIVDKLQSRTRGTLYAFIGLQLVDISQAHIYPARQEFWKALQTEGESRIEFTRNAWQQTARARDLLEQLTGQFERARREYALAETIDKIKKMYQIYVENSLALMREAGDSSPYARTRVEFDLDEEYLARLKEVIEMRNEMRAELARLLADDPRLLRRFLDAERNRTNVLRYELADLVDQQGALNRKSKAWEVVEEARRPELAALLLQRHVKGIETIAFAAADLHDRFETWLPLQRDVQDADLLATGKLLQQIAAATREVSANAGKFAAQKTGLPSSAAQETTTDEQLPKTKETTTPNENSTLKAIVEEAEQLYEQFNQLEVLLSQIGMRDGQAQIAGFATNRRIETRRLVEQISAWIRQLKYHQSAEYHRAVEIEQYRLAIATDSFAGKFANLEQQLAATLQINDGTLPQPIAEKARRLLAMLDEQAAPNQLAAVYGLRRNQLPRAISRQESALEALTTAETEYDEMIQLVITELDKFPVQDPIASLLDDPTLDELLAQLEQELPIQEILGIPARPSNLQIMDDWLRNGNGSGGVGYNQNQMLMNKLREQQLERQRAIEQAYRKALASALKESNGVVIKPSAPARKTVDWNRLVSQLDDDLQQGRNTAPPERYRRAIEQYFRQISGSTKEAPTSN